MRKMELVLKNVVQILVLIAFLTRVESNRVPGRPGISKIQEIPQYRFHYYLQDDKTAGDYQSTQENKHGEKVGQYNAAVSNGDMQIVNYRIDKSNGLQSDFSTTVGASPFKISLNNPVYNTQADVSKESTLSSDTSPIVVEQINTQEQKSSKSIEIDSRDEYNLTESTDKVTTLTEQVSTNQPEDRKDDVKDEQANDDHIIIQDDGITVKQTEFTIPFKKPIPVNTDDLKYNDDEAIKKDIVKVIQNINGNREQSDTQLHFKSTSDNPLKIVETDSMEMEQQESYQPSHGLSKFKSQQFSNKPMRLVGYNPSIFGSLYDIQVDYNRASQIQQPPNLFNPGYFAGFGTHGNVKQQSYDNSGIYYSQPSSTSKPSSTSQSSSTYQPSSAFQPGSSKGNQKSNLLTQNQPLYYYDPNSMVMLPVYTNMIQNDYQITEIKPQPTQQPTDSGKSGFNLMQILSGGSFYKGSEQAEGSQQITVKDSIKPEHNKIEKLKPLETHNKPKPLETHDKLKSPQTLMFYLNPGETPIDLKTLTSSPMQLTFGQQPQADCNGKTPKATTVKSNKPPQPIPLCSDCMPTLGVMGPSTQSASVQQKKSIGTPQVMPIWNGKTVSKLNYLILPTPLTK